MKARIEAALVAVETLELTGTEDEVKRAAGLRRATLRGITSVHQDGCLRSALLSLSIDDEADALAFCDWLIRTSTPAALRAKASFWLEKCRTQHDGTRVFFGAFAASKKKAVRK